MHTGSWFTLERWIAPGVFEGVDGSSEIDVARQAPDARERLERHWQSWITDEDWDKIREHGFNSVRIPVRILSISSLPFTGCIGV